MITNSVARWLLASYHTLPVPIIDDAHLVPVEALRKLRLLLEDFPPNHNLIARSAQGTLRATKNLCIGALIEAVRDRTSTVDLKHVNAVLLQPHWRHNPLAEPNEPVLIPPTNLPVRS